MIFSSRDIYYKNPFGAVAAGTPVALRLALPKHLHTPELLVYADDNFEAPAYRIAFVQEGVRSGDTVWQASFTPPVAQLLFYRFAANGGSVYIGAELDGSAKLNDADLWQLTVYDPAFTTPHALWGAVFYQIFPDRFCNSGTPKNNVPADRILHKSWEEDPISRPDAQGKFLCNDYFGGDLRGIMQKLPYLADLGVEGIYLNPIFEAHSNHRYNTADYMTIDPLLGTREDFVALCEEAHRLGMRVVLDGVLNHTGSDSVYFNLEKRYGEHTGASNDPASPYHDWFCWIDYPKSYNCWWGFKTLPDVNENSATYRDFICGEQGVLRSWLRAGADGFRLDVADELPDDFIADIRTAIKTENPEALLLGEVWEDASNKTAYSVRRKYFLGAELDSVMNYPWRSAILNFVRDGGGSALLDAVSIIMENYPPPALGVMLNSLSTHDVPRALTAIAAPLMDGRDRDWQRANNTLVPDAFYYGRQLLLLAAVIQYTLPGCPCLYYGDEAGLVGYADPFNRGVYPWGREDDGMVEFFRLLGGLRKNLPVLRLGSFAPVAFEKNAVVYLRQYEGERILVAINRSRDGYKIPYDMQELKASDVLLAAGGVLGHDMLYGNSAAIIRLAAQK